MSSIDDIQVPRDIIGKYTSKWILEAFEMEITSQRSLVIDTHFPNLTGDKIEIDKLSIKNKELTEEINKYKLLADSSNDNLKMDANFIGDSKRKEIEIFRDSLVPLREKLMEKLKDDSVDISKSYEDLKYPGDWYGTIGLTMLNKVWDIIFSNRNHKVHSMTRDMDKVITIMKNLKMRTDSVIKSSLFVSDELKKYLNQTLKDLELYSVWENFNQIKEYIKSFIEFWLYQINIIEDLEKKIHNHKEDISGNPQLELLNKDLTEKSLEYIKTIKDLNNELTTYKENYAKLSKDGSENIIKMLEKKNLDNENKIAVLKKENDDVYKDLNAERKNVIQYLKDNEKLKEKQSEETGKLRTEVLEKLNDNDILKKRTIDLQKENEILKTENEKMTLLNKTLLKDNDEMKIKLTNNSDEIKTLEEDHLKELNPLKLEVERLTNLYEEEKENLSNEILKDFEDQVREINKEMKEAKTRFETTIESDLWESEKEYIRSGFKSVYLKKWNAFVTTVGLSVIALEASNENHKDKFLELITNFKNNRESDIKDYEEIIKNLKSSLDRINIKTGIAEYKIKQETLEKIIVQYKQLNQVLEAEQLKSKEELDTYKKSETFENRENFYNVSADLKILKEEKEKEKEMLKREKDYYKSNIIEFVKRSFIPNLQYTSISNKESELKEKIIKIDTNKSVGEYLKIEKSKNKWIGATPNKKYVEVQMFDEDINVEYLEILQKISNEYLQNIYYFRQYKSSILLTFYMESAVVVSEYIGGLLLSEYLDIKINKNGRNINELSCFDKCSKIPTLLKCFKEILSGIKVLHANDITHGNLNCNSILFDGINDNYRLTNFNVLRIPEEINIIKQKSQDIKSFGILVLEVFRNIYEVGNESIMDTKNPYSFIENFQYYKENKPSLDNVSF
jgi:serine/threonine protein kinase